MNIAVTGANGFLGRWVCQELHRHGHAVLALTRPGNLRPKEESKNLSVDLCTANSLQALDSFPLDAVIHLAAALPISFFGASAQAAEESNRIMDDAVTTYCLRRRTALVLASSCSVYGMGTGSDVIDGAVELRPAGPYAEGKAKSERQAMSQLAAENIPFSSLRISAPYGPGQRTRTVLRIFLERALAGQPLLYHGSGSREQDFTFAGDVAEAFRLAIETRASGIFNVATGRPVSMVALAELVARLLPNRSVRILPSGQEDPQEGALARYAVASTLASIGWEARTSLEDGLSAWLEDWEETGP